MSRAGSVESKQRRRLVGRQAELDQLRKVVDRIPTGSSEWTIIEGTPGIGKTRLLEDFLLYAGDAGLLVLRGEADEVEQSRPFHPLLQALRQLDSAAAELHEIRAMVGYADHRQDVILDGIADFSHQIIDVLADVLERACMRAPTVLALEDVQWADSSTLRAVRSLARRLDRFPFGIFLTVRDVVAAARNLAPEDRQANAATYLGELRTGGGIVEELITGDEFGSPSVQLRNSPLSEVEIISTHDQVLGGPTGQMFLGCRFPADPAYVRAISEEAMKVGKRLASEGVVGRYGIDFVVTRNGAGSWLPYAIEINLGNGGTTHPFLTLIALTDGIYNPASGIFTAPDGTERHYMATDHVEDERLKRLTPDDLLDLSADAPLAWEAEALMGPAFHLVSAIAVAGQVGVTAIAGSREGAHEVYSTVKQRLVEEATKA